MSDYSYLEKRRRQTIVDSVMVGPGNYEESFTLDFPVHLVGAGPHKCALGNPTKSIKLFQDESGRKSSIQGFRLTQQVWAWKARVDFVGNVFTPEYWGSDSFFPRCAKESTMLLEDCSSYVELISNTFQVPSAVTLIKSSPKVYSNLFPEKCTTAIWGQDSNSRPKIGGSTSRANSFMGSRVFFTNTKPSARYNWWGTTDEEVLKRELGEHVYYSGYLKAPPANVGAQIPEQERGDFNNDNRVGLTDFMYFVTHFGAKPGDNNWNPLYDLDFDGHVGLSDFSIFITNYNNVFGSNAKFVMPDIVAQSKVADFFPPYPNPFNSITTINFHLSKPEPVILKVYNVLGQEVVELVSSSLVGDHTVQWNGQDSNGHLVGSGTYFFVLQVANSLVAQRVVFIK